MTEKELLELIGGKRPGVVAELLRLRLAERQGDAFLVRSPGLLQVAVKLESAGVDLETASGGAAIIRKHASRAARDLTEYFFVMRELIESGKAARLPARKGKEKALSVRPFAP